MTKPLPRNLVVQLLLTSVAVRSTTAWSPASLSVFRSSCRHQQHPYQQQRVTTNLYSSNNKEPERATATAEWEDEDAGAGVVGAQFFGGNKQKEEFYDPVAEAEASKLAFEEAAATFDRFSDRNAFDTVQAAELAASYQKLLNAALSDSVTDTQQNAVLAGGLRWESALASGATSPLTALAAATKFYRRIHVAITSAKTLSDTKYEFRWEIGLAWPTFWEPSVLVTGTSTLEVADSVITRQIDKLDDPDLLASLGRQIVPRFWDVYHIGMTPTAELSPAWERRQGLVQNFVLYDVPSRWVWAPTLLDRGNREDANASFLPNHAFTTAIRTMGPKKDNYVPTSPTQIDIAPSKIGNRVTWKIPLTVELQAQDEWPLFQSDADDEQQDGTEDASGSYAWQPARRVATIPTGIARSQDEGVTDLRKRLYDLVTSAGLKPKLDGNGRPCFFFWSATTKTCFTDQGLGMSVYEWRPKFAQSNYVGLELEETPELTKASD
eukprot:scaffold5383_cov222-Amphora_coffeaeformis.AAC.24